ncbi:hypothetical protein [Streptomyces iconiensis]|uniref:IrrE N-terminal-like domain-containing protein n=1 Tax=Streptomyces iconiensis TaxID=1384038 RepID=A0ABT7A608_9ACTN|nr:hypothetical protein [Streptomyces iconiensis]MDJ1136271.1 hypothetical protein [Streptomyces iconiensis]
MRREHEDENMWPFPDLLRRPRTVEPGERELRRRIRLRFRRLEVQPPLSVPDLCEAVAQERGREIELRPLAVPACGPQGLWLDLPAADVIVFQERTSRVHQDHIVLHELSHIVAGHRGCAGVEGLRRAFPALSDAAIRRVLQRHSYSGAEEREAEMIATIIGEWASVLDEIVPPGRCGDRAGARVRGILGDHRGWQ